MTGSTESGKISLVLYVDVEHGVLIETLWNVKSCLQLSGSALQQSINRNIVECKDIFSTFEQLIQFRINRNIVECKVPSGAWQLAELGLY